MVYRPGANNGVVENRNGRKGDVISWSRVIPTSFRFMEIASPRTGNNNAAIYFEMMGLENQTQVWRMASPKQGGSAFTRAETYQDAAYRKLRRQEEEDGLVLVSDSQAYVAGGGQPPRETLPASNKRSEGSDSAPHVSSGLESI